MEIQKKQNKTKQIHDEKKNKLFLTVETSGHL